MAMLGQGSPKPYFAIAAFDIVYRYEQTVPGAYAG
jgi:hypothetical protein